MVHLTNNARILINIKNHINNLELKEREKSLLSEDKSTINFSSYCYDYKENLLDDIADRLDVGAEKYHEEVPIDKADDSERNNIYESYEELCDTLVYLSAALLRKKEDSNNVDMKVINELFQNILRSTILLMGEMSK
tara:strand:+ start:541 stop:951 length:411 start_codon:yes stop_codon:yes gene_type:complete